MNDFIKGFRSFFSVLKGSFSFFSDSEVREVLGHITAFFLLVGFMLGLLIFISSILNG